jgi:hypothetical protein
MTTNITNTVAVIVKSQEATNAKFLNMLTMMEAKLEKLEPPEKRFRTSSGAHMHLEHARGGADEPVDGAEQQVETDNMTMPGEICSLCHFLMLPSTSFCAFLSTHTCVRFIHPPQLHLHTRQVHGDASLPNQLVSLQV